MRDLQTGVEYLWPKAKFINRKYVMDEMYENFEDGDDWQLEDEKDPFTESPDVESLIGCVAVPMQSLGYVVSMPLLFADDLCYFPLFLIILVPFSLLLSRKC